MAKETYDRVHAEYKAVGAAIHYTNKRRADWRENSLKTTNDEVWTTNMPLYIQSETDPSMRAKLE
jgi:hypothetical protein